ncbi:predicted protein [Histoplasma capsulatum var. duboisii H88]|uniref:Predicted protein n=2 Tax=Ajellomyces capsulatus TaxID=5037 RepID=F0U4Q9_AJEC8|nr:predicted protein [Histoplasma capsulatum H143]EGC42006.1 predicted protein [Histoplasma capsulatum var. duboisii H88]
MSGPGIPPLGSRGSRGSRAYPAGDADSHTRHGGRRSSGGADWPLRAGGEAESSIRAGGALFFRLARAIYHVDLGKSQGPGKTRTRSRQTKEHSELSNTTNRIWNC